MPRHPAKAFRKTKTEMKTDTHTHTPGPWTYYMTISDNGPVPQVQTVPVGPVGGAYATMICTLSRTGRKSGVGEANARLIAAAPDLLAVLKSLVRETSHFLHGDGKDGAIVANELRNAVFAIHKVEGNA